MVLCSEVFLLDHVTEKYPSAPILLYQCSWPKGREPFKRHKAIQTLFRIPDREANIKHFPLLCKLVMLLKKITEIWVFGSESEQVWIENQ